MASNETPLDKFNNQRSRAARRGIDWLFTFEAWWKVWQDSGRWNQRGNKVGKYVMARHGDIGPYCPDNVFICTHAQNIKDAQIGHHRGLGVGRGWTFRAQAKHKPYQVTVRRKYVGCFATAAEAEAAYVNAVEKVRLHKASIFFYPSDKH